MSCRFCGTAERTVRVVAYDPIVTYACGTEFFPTEQELGEPLDKCWSQSQECKAKAPVKEDGKRAARLDTYPTAHVEALEARLFALEAEAKQAESDTGWALSHGAIVHRDDGFWYAVAKNECGSDKNLFTALRALRAKVELEDEKFAMRYSVAAFSSAIRALREKVEGGKR